MIRYKSRRDLPIIRFGTFCQRPVELSPRDVMLRIYTIIGLYRVLSYSHIGANVLYLHSNDMSYDGISGNSCAGLTSAP